MRIGDLIADPRGIHATIVHGRHALQMHGFLLVATVIVHDEQQRNVVMRGSPQGTRRVHQIAVRLESQGQQTLLAIGQRGADCGRQRITLSRTARAA